MESDRATEGTEWFPSKVDAWVAFFLAVPPISAVLTVLGAARTGFSLVALAPAALVLLIYGTLLFPTTYGLGSRELVVRAGFVRSRIPLHRIRLVRPTRAPWSSPALSLDRLRIEWGDGTFEHIRISPRDRSRFLEQLAEKAGLTRNGERLERREADASSPASEPQS